jgi:hypothetical protein
VHRHFTRTLPALMAAVGLSVFSSGGPAGAATHAVSITKQTAKQIETASLEAEENVQSVRVLGKINESSGTIAFDLLDAGDDSGIGNFTEQGQTVQVAKIGAALFFNAPKAFWLKNDTAKAASIYGGRWIEVAASNPDFSTFAQFMNPGPLAFGLFAGVKNVKKEGIVKATGIKTEELLGTEGSGTHKTKSAMFVAITGKPYIIAIVATGGDESGGVEFARYGAPLTIKPPANPIVLQQP